MVASGSEWGKGEQLCGWMCNKLMILGAGSSVTTYRAPARQAGIANVSNECACVP